MIFRPTYLYIKQHTITGKLYFGKSSRSLTEMLKYKGSGTQWKYHIKSHGKSFVITLWYEYYDNVFDLVADALSLSNQMDIINSKLFLNLMYENGLDGSSVISDTTRLKLSQCRTGKLNPFYGKKHSADSLALISNASKGRIVSEERKIQTSISMSGQNNHNYGKPVSQDRRDKQSAKMKGRKRTKEHNDNVVEAMTFRYDVLIDDTYYLIKISTNDICNLFGYTKQCVRYAFKKNGKYKRIVIIKKY